MLSDTPVRSTETYCKKGIFTMKYLRIPALCLALCFLVSTFCGCESRPIKSTDEEMQVVGQVGTYDIYYEELRYLTLKFRDSMATTYGEDIWTDPAKAEQYRDELTQNVYHALTANIAVRSLCAEVLIDYTDDAIQKAVQKDVDATVEEFGSKSAYREGLAGEYMTDNLYRYSLAIGYCESELLYAYTDDLGIIADTNEELYSIIMSDEFARTLHVFISNDAGDDIEANRTLAEKVLNEYRSGTAFNTLIGRYSEDFYMTTTNGYYFTHGEMQQNYEDAAFALAEDEVSDVVETPSGFYIIHRLPKDAQYVLSHLDELSRQYQYAVLYNLIDERRAELTFTPNELCLGLDLVTLP